MEYHIAGLVTYLFIRIYVGVVEYHCRGCLFFCRNILNWVVADDGLGVLTSICSLMCDVGCKKITLWYGTVGDTGGTVNLWSCTGRYICGRVDVRVATGRTIVIFFCGSSEEFCYFDKWVFSSITIYQIWYNWRRDFQDVNDVCCWLIDIIL